MNFRTLSDPPQEEQFELPFGEDYYEEKAELVVPPSEFIGGGIAVAAAVGENYAVKTPAGTTTLVRDTDFGVIPGTKQPSLFKAGAEKIAMAYGLLQHYTIEDMHQEFGDSPVMFYLVKCELVKIHPVSGKEYVFTTGYGSANTREKRNGRSDAYNAANSCIKMAQKRALTAAALSISGLSSMFTQDLDNEDFVNSNIAALSATNNPNAPITRKQRNLIFAKAGDRGMLAPQAKKIIADAGLPSVSALTQKDYQKVLELFDTPAEREAREAQRGETDD